MQRERISIPKNVLYIVMALLLYVLQSSWFGMWSIRGYHLDLLPALVAAAALLDGPAAVSYTHRHRCRIHLVQKTLGGFVIPGDDALRVTGVIGIDVADRLVKRIHNLA